MEGLPAPGRGVGSAPLHAGAPGPVGGHQLPGLGFDPAPAAAVEGFHEEGEGVDVGGGPARVGAVPGAVGDDHGALPLDGELGGGLHDAGSGLRRGEAEAEPRVGEDRGPLGEGLRPQGDDAGAGGVGGVAAVAVVPEADAEGGPPGPRRGGDAKEAEAEGGGARGREPGPGVLNRGRRDGIRRRRSLLRSPGDGFLFGGRRRRHRVVTAPDPDAADGRHRQQCQECANGGPCCHHGRSENTTGPRRREDRPPPSPRTRPESRRSPCPD